MSDTEHALLRDPNGGDPFVASVPRDASLFRVPNRDDLPDAIRGLTFERTGHAVAGLPTFRKRARQV